MAYERSIVFFLDLLCSYLFVRLLRREEEAGLGERARKG